ncbi:cytidylyltransferase domain-containing protein [Solitalea lacus]|uniref:acylneuraminate cytidylyltransferase family protein n=1 Tax=Solitalea lacus TaxID=2911172 RepID=UPI001EDA427F|nr:acylneuraminate cytidylyltransferase family protein [Solitalea lacus]UKJ08231.1 acylneuraminate cytidylyltransferase family protein [Solitalea lacus]
MITDTLFIIPARGGSKGIPDKNIKPLGGKPLIHWSIAIARALTEDENICVSTDSEKIKEVAEQTGLKVPFLRPQELATDNAGTYEVLLHALQFYKEKGKEYKNVVLLQPTSPFRSIKQVKEAIELYNEKLDMIVSVRESSDSPYYTLFEENAAGYLKKSKESNFVRRQDCPKVYAYNGAIYVINVESLLKQPVHQFSKIKKYVMDEISSIDLDTPLDWAWAEFVLEKGMVK